jgi:hypothetical protein
MSAWLVLADTTHPLRGADLVDEVVALLVRQEVLQKERTRRPGQMDNFPTPLLLLRRQHRQNSASVETDCCWDPARTQINGLSSPPSALHNLLCAQCLELRLLAASSPLLHTARNEMPSRRPSWLPRVSIAFLHLSLQLLLPSCNYCLQVPELCRKIHLALLLLVWPLTGQHCLTTQHCLLLRSEILASVPSKYLHDLSVEILAIASLSVSHCNVWQHRVLQWERGRSPLSTEWDKAQGLYRSSCRKATSCLDSSNSSSTSPALSRRPRLLKHFPWQVSPMLFQPSRPAQV